jgi:predicted lysophospholipase L1 biosynthesis ABC-type transport system permease subunit
VTERRALTVVGVVDDPAARSQLPGGDPVVYVPADMLHPAQQMLIRTTSPARPLLPTIRDVVNREAPGAVADANTLAGLADQERANLRIVYGGISAASAIALLLAAIGLYAVVAFSVSQRMHEIAVRLSVGARGGQIARAFIGDGLRLSLIGMAIGLPLSLVALKLVLNPLLVYHVPVAPVAAIAALSVIIVAAAATWIPAQRAAAVDPAKVLRNG